MMVSGNRSERQKITTHEKYFSTWSQIDRVCMLILYRTTTDIGPYHTHNDEYINGHGRYFIERKLVRSMFNVKLNTTIANAEESKRDIPNMKPTVCTVEDVPKRMGGGKKCGEYKKIKPSQTQ